MLRFLPEFNKNYISTPAADTDAVVTLAADSNVTHAIRGIAWSYDGDPTGGGITISDGTDTLFSIDIVTGGPGYIDLFGTTKQSSNGSALIVTLLAGGSGVTGKLNVLGYEEV